mmetsp:Transcript_27780/g.54561  ORF Transcript_27780/g.54561 Transcript_27780/m.54561 type:complete len:561 (-) Transcript_27780:49-1731(-)
MTRTTAQRKGLLLLIHALQGWSVPVGMLDHVLQAKMYDRNLMPPAQSDGSGPLVINASISIQELWDVAAKEKTFNVEVDLVQEWSDPRLTWQQQQFQGVGELVLDRQADIDKIWIPDTFWFHANHYIKKVRMQIYLRVTSEGKVQLSRRDALEMRCSMNLRHFPFDTQHCGLAFGSYSQPLHKLDYRWDSLAGGQGAANAFTTRDNFLRGEMCLCTTCKEAIKVDRGTRTSRNTNFTFRKMVAIINLQRHNSRYVWTSFLPSTAVAIIAYCSYWIAPYAAPARVSVVVVSSLTSATLLQSAKSYMVSPYMTALELFVLVHFWFVLLAMLEYTLVHFLLSYSFELHHPNSHAAKVARQRKAERRLLGLRELREEECENSRPLLPLPSGPEGDGSKGKPMRELQRGALYDIAFSENELRDFFAATDKSCKGRVTLQDIEHAVPVLGLEDVPQTQLHHHFQNASCNGSVLDPAEFVDFMAAITPLHANSGSARGVHMPLELQPWKVRGARWVAWKLADDPLIIDRNMRLWVFVVEVLWQLFYWIVWQSGWEPGEAALVSEAYA